MRNTWKGLVVGGLTGALVGIALDAVAIALDKAVLTAETARDRAPGAVDWVQSHTGGALRWLHDADVPDRARVVAKRVLDPNFAAATAASATKVIGVTTDRARSSLNHFA